MPSSLLLKLMLLRIPKVTSVTIDPYIPGTIIYSMQDNYNVYFLVIGFFGLVWAFATESGSIFHALDVDFSELSFPLAEN